MSDHKPCCDACDGTGIASEQGTSGRCWDCYGTGCAHPPPDHVDRATEVILSGQGIVALRRDEAAAYARLLDAAGLLASPEHDAEVAAKAANRVLAVIQDDLGGMRDTPNYAKTFDDALRFVRGYVSGAAINERVQRIEREGGAS